MVGYQKQKVGVDYNLRVFQSFLCLAVDPARDPIQHCALDLQARNDPVALANRTHNFYHDPCPMDSAMDFRLHPK